MGSAYYKDEKREVKTGEQKKNGRKKSSRLFFFGCTI